MHASVVIVLEGHLTEESLETELGKADAALKTHVGDKLWLIVDALPMTGYDAQARALFVTWNRDRRPRLHGVAIITKRTLWRVVVAAMSLATGQHMRTFDTVEAARTFCSAS